MAKKHERRRAREDALSLLYSSDITESEATRLIDEGGYPADIELSEYAESLVRGVAEHRAGIDARLAATSENWSVDRMPVVDRAILRLAVYEMLYVDEVPVSVAINEAVELAKAYGGEDDSSRFVNGVLGRIARATEESRPHPNDAGRDPADVPGVEGEPAPRPHPDDAGHDLVGVQGAEGEPASRPHPGDAGHDPAGAPGAEGEPAPRSHPDDAGHDLVGVQGNEGEAR